ncbi:MAG: hypothetical protein IT449_02235 [Phycisphaerales bacterium]|nr:hypothetical protein [Phycisphaerales bacterium]
MPPVDVLHQPRAMGQIQRALRSSRLAHAFVFHGPEGVGRELAARQLAAALLCPDARWVEVPAQRREHVEAPHELRACGACQDCRLCDADTHPDLHVVHRFLNRFHDEDRVRKLKASQLSVDVVRQFIIAETGRKPARGRAKVFIIRDADRLSASAENALLKTLEEPPDDTFMILIAPSPQDLLATTRSRSALIAFDALPKAFVQRQLSMRHRDKPPATLAWAAAFSAGSLGRALELLEDGVYEVNEAFVRGWIGAPADPSILDPDLWIKTAGALGSHCKKRDEELSDSEGQRMGLKQLIALSAACFADALRMGSGADALRVRSGAGAILNEQARPALQACADRWDRGAVCATLDRLHRAESHLDMNANTQLVVEALLYDVFAALRGEAMVAG